MPDIAHRAALARAEPTVRAALGTHRTTAAIATARLQPVPGGLSNLAWRATADTGESYFVRLTRRQVEVLGADHRNECRVLRVTAAARLSPVVVRCDPDRQLLVTRWIDADEPGRIVHGNAQIGAVAKALAQLHGLPAPTSLRQVDFEVQARRLQAALADGALADAASGVFDALRMGRQTAVLCHNDLNPLNLLFDRDGRLWLVDWEYAGLGDRAIDLASFASQHGFGARQRRALLDAYAAAGGVVEVRRVDWALWAFDYVQYLWYRAGGAGQDGIVAPELAVERAGRLAALLRVRASRLLRCDNSKFAE